jgi:hypothetical protein
MTAAMVAGAKVGDKFRVAGGSPGWQVAGGFELKGRPEAGRRLREMHYFR